MGKLKTFFFSQPAFLFLLPLFFVLHGFAVYFSLIPFHQAIGVLLVYLASTLLLSAGFQWVFHSPIKAALATLFIMGFEFFFGNVHDWLKATLPGSFVTKYSVLFFLFIALLFTMVFYLKRTGRSFRRLRSYLSLLILLLIVLDIGMLVQKAINPKPILPSLPTLRPCKNCSQPDIYFLLADEYPGQKALSEVFAFNNDVFRSALKQRGFFTVEQSTSNYNSTPYSLASTLNMGYLQLNTHEININDLLTCIDEIKRNALMQFFEGQGYRIYNHSIFDIDNKPSPLHPIFLSPRWRLLTSTTFTARVEKDLGFHFLTAEERKQIGYTVLTNNNTADSLTRLIARENKDEKKFVYTHLELPHHPYYFDSAGILNPQVAANPDTKFDKKLFLGYLQYSNHRILSLIDYIQTHATQPPVIVLLSDHGFRQFTKKVDPSLYFSNVSAIYLPNQDFTGFYKGMSNVNVFRTILNKQFGQQLPLLKDTSIFIQE